MNDKLEADVVYSSRPSVTVDAHKYTCLIALDTMLETVFGWKLDTLNNPDTEFARRSDDVVHCVMRSTGLPVWAQPLVHGNRGFRELTEYRNMIKRIVDERIAQDFPNGLHEKPNGDEEKVLESLQRRRDVLSLLIHSARIENATVDEIVDEAQMFFAAGHETSGNTMGYILRALAERPHLVQKVREEMREVTDDFTRELQWEDLSRLKWIDAIIKETQRCFSVTPFTGREIVKTMTLPSGWVLPAGATAALCFQSVHNNEKYWDRPREFLPERWLDEKNPQPKIPGTFFPFGHGPQSCIGFKFALTEMAVVIGRIVCAFDIEPAWKDESELVEAFSVTLGYKASGLPLTFRPASLSMSS
eukprot:Clim_evm35s55 gene=Clim_evmTU35s55